MAMAILKSFNRDLGFAILKLDGQTAELAAHVTGSDRAVLSAVVSGQRISFDLQRDRHGRTFAVDVRRAPLND